MWMRRDSSILCFPEREALGGEGELAGKATDRREGLDGNTGQRGWRDPVRESVPGKATEE